MLLIGFNILAIANLILLSVILVLKKPTTQANRVLGIIVLYPIFTMLLNIIYYEKMVEEHRWIFFLCYLINYLWAPSFLRYINLMLQKPFRYSYRHFVHYIPFLITLIFFIWLNLQPHPYRHDMLLRTQQENYPWQFKVLDFMSLFQFCLYISIFHQIMHKRIDLIKQTFSDNKSISARWLLEFIHIYAGLGFLAFFPVVINANTLGFLIYMPIACLVCYTYLVYKNMNSPFVFTPERLTLISQVENNKKNSERVQQSDGSDEERIMLAFQLEKVLQKEKLYLNSELNIQILAERSEISVHTLSRLINNHHNKNFFDFINYYRIEEAKKILADPNQQKYTIDSIAGQVGFNSRSAFYNAFKRNTDTTPSEYLKSFKR